MSDSAPTAQLTPLRINWDVIAVLALFFGAFALYARTTAPGVLDGDFGEFQTNIFNLGVSHTGYPLYFILAKLWTLIMPVGTIAARANVFSGFFGALTLVLIYGMVRTLSERRLVALFAAVIFGISRVQWSQSVIPDVYTLNSFFIVLLLWLAILWRMGRVPLWTVALTAGLALTHHRTTVLLAPALLLFILLGADRSFWKPRNLLINTAALLLPLLLYLYLPLRGASDVGVEYHPGNNVNILALNAFYDLRFGPPGFLWERFTQTYLPLLIEQFSLLGFMLGLGGVIALAGKRVPRGFPTNLPPRHLLLLLGLAHIAQSAFAICFWVVDSEIFFIPSFLTFLFFIAIALAVVLDEISSRIAARSVDIISLDKLVSPVAAVLLLFFLFPLGAGNLPRVDASNNDTADARWQEILTQPIEPNSWIVGPWEDLTPLEYYQYVEGARRDLKRVKVVLFQDQLALAPQADLVNRIESALTGGANIYLTRHPATTETLGELEQFELVPLASLWRVQNRDKRGADSVAFDAAEDLQRLILTPAYPRAGEFLTLTLVWSPESHFDTRLIVTLRDANGRVLATQESYPPPSVARAGDGKNPRTLHGIIIPPDAPPGNYSLEIAAFERDSPAPRPLLGDESSITRDILIQAPQTPTAREFVSIPRPLNADLGAAQFLGFNVSELEPRGADEVELSTWWQGLTSLNHRLRVSLTDSADVSNILYDGMLLPPFPQEIAALNPAQILRARHDLTIPPDISPGYGKLELALDDQLLPPIRISLRPTERKFRVPIIQSPQLTLVGDSIQLLGYQINPTTRAGQPLDLTLYWSVNQRPPAGYKVFVHLVNADGALVAQQDNIPQNGTLPTDRWFAGEYITDLYTLQLPPGLPAGMYHLRVGMYNETTGARVPLLTSNNIPVPDDAVTLQDPITVAP